MPPLPEERLAFLSKVASAYPTLPSARKARSHLRYTKPHFHAMKNVGRVILEEYFREDIMVLRNFNFSYYYELLYAPCVAAPFRLTTFGTFPEGQARPIA